MAKFISNLVLSTTLIRVIRGYSFPLKVPTDPWFLRYVRLWEASKAVSDKKLGERPKIGSKIEYGTSQI